MPLSTALASSNSDKFLLTQKIHFQRRLLLNFQLKFIFNLCLATKLFITVMLTDIYAGWREHKQTYIQINAPQRLYKNIVQVVSI